MASKASIGFLSCSTDVAFDACLLAYDEDTKDDDGKILQLHKSKLNALEETLEETDGKVIIWANYLYNIHEIKDFLSNFLLAYLLPHTLFDTQKILALFGHLRLFDLNKRVFTF